MSRLATKRVGWGALLGVSALVLGLSALAGRASANSPWPFGPTLPHAPDDRTMSAGNTRAASDVKWGWNTTGPDDFEFTTTADSCTVVSSDSGIDRTGLTCTDTRLCVCSDDATNPDECLCGWHDETSCNLACDDGPLVLASSASQIVYLGEGDETAPIYAFQGAAASAIDVQLAREGGGGIFGALSSGAFDQVTLYTGAGAGNQVVLTAAANKAKDHDHAAPADPTLFIQSDTDPDTLNTEWLSLAHNQTNAIIETGKGDLHLLPVGDNVVVGSNSGDMQINVLGGNAGAAGVTWATDGTAAALEQYGATNQLVLSLSSESGNQLVIGAFSNLGKDYDHAGGTDSVLYIQSAEDPDTANTQWLSLSHNQTDAVAATGLGDLLVDPAGNDLLVGDHTNYAGLNETGSGVVFGGTGRPTKRFWVPAELFADGIVPGCTYGQTANQNRWAVGNPGAAPLIDPTDESIRTRFPVPWYCADGENINVAIYHARTVGAGGDVVWRIDFLSMVAGGDLADALTAGTQTAAITLGGGTDLAIHDSSTDANLIVPGATVATGELLVVEVRRMASDAGDTFGGDIDVLGVWFGCTADRG